MATNRQLHKLNALKVSKESTPGYYADGGGLYLQISKSGSRSWIFRFSLAKRSREMGLGALATVSLAEARGLASECRKMLAEGRDPIEVRNAHRERAALEETDSLTFKKAATDYIENNRASWKNAKHAQQWTNTLQTYAFPIIGKIDVRHVDTSMVVRVLQPIWAEKTETASRVRGRIECVLDYAKAIGKRAGENPARWRGHLDKVFPAEGKVHKIRHHPALPYAELPAFMRELRQREGVSARVLELTILTCARTTEALDLQPEELQLRNRLWIVPPARMKAKREHRVPMCDRAIELVQAALDQPREGKYLFPGEKKGRPLSNMAMLNLLERMGYPDITVHGFRSTFRDWVADCTEYPDSIADMALAHVVADKTDAAYRRGDMLERRRRLMDEWAKFCNGETAAVLPFTGAKAQSAA
ncbi:MULTISPECIES: phage integrase central domain-containing protein [unclassified Caballeronia]|uniref:tyrosine-type recombinase/integrase n=1 Tax=unclassified Caballeronia TaxID=2646786 RepID=UPI00285C6D2A|nr:integrase arm-type DNA-binding domain-containing protein [Caballeronia sp. LZ001]MDR5771223.1 integrase arm-type DNA-binding domain-containing protein [Caballeronia sp. LZ002]MDR5801611.1 integrase arm-type DNA-binding domain-containing protein [Caballeronia sp. LZ001]MDR5846660.1 integrase arm-type DNA-binding domain-containing protein [Caballeronia sp. LZ003]